MIVLNNIPLGQIYAEILDRIKVNHNSIFKDNAEYIINERLTLIRSSNGYTIDKKHYLDYFIALGYRNGSVSLIIDDITNCFAIGKPISGLYLISYNNRKDNLSPVISKTLYQAFKELNIFIGQTSAK